MRRLWAQWQQRRVDRRIITRLLVCSKQVHIGVRTGSMLRVTTEKAWVWWAVAPKAPNHLLDAIERQIQEIEAEKLRRLKGGTGEAE